MALQSRFLIQMVFSKPSVSSPSSRLSLVFQRSLITSVTISPTRPLPSCAAAIVPASGRKRTFILPSLTQALGSSSPQILTASKIIPYPPDQVFSLVADVDSYAQFVPYCQKSRVTHWISLSSSGGATQGKIYEQYDNDVREEGGRELQRNLPLQADLHVGWGGFEEVFTSRLTCDPNAGLVEARSGRDVKPLPSLPSSKLSHSLSQSSLSSSERNRKSSALAGGTVSTENASGTTGTPASVFTSLVTRWKIQPLVETTTATSTTSTTINKKTPTTAPSVSLPGKEWSRIDLRIEFQFSNPLYAAVSSAVSDKMASVMTEAFEQYARRKLGERING